MSQEEIAWAMLAMLIIGTALGRASERRQTPHACATRWHTRLRLALGLRYTTRHIERRLRSGAVYVGTLPSGITLIISQAQVTAEIPHEYDVEPGQIQELLLTARYPNGRSSAIRRPAAREIADALAAHLRLVGDSRA